MYSVCKFNFSKIPTPFTHTKRVSLKPPLWPNFYFLKNSGPNRFCSLVWSGILFSSDQWPMEGDQRGGLWELQGVVQAQPHLPVQRGQERANTHWAEGVQVRTFNAAMGHSHGIFPILRRLEHSFAFTSPSQYGGCSPFHTPPQRSCCSLQYFLLAIRGHQSSELNILYSSWRLVAMHQPRCTTQGQVQCLIPIHYCTEMWIRSD